MSGIPFAEGNHVATALVPPCLPEPFRHLWSAELARLPMPELTIRSAKKGDEDLIFTLMHELADYEKLLDKFNVTREVILRDYLCDAPLLNCHLAFEGDMAVGVMTWYWTYTSFAAARGVYLEDLYVRPQTRGKGYGKALLAHLAQTAVSAGASR